MQQQVRPTLRLLRPGRLMPTRRKSDTVADQLRSRILSGIHLGALRPGQRLWSVRELGRELRIDPRVALAAYGALAGEGTVELRRRSGVFLTSRRPTLEDKLPRNADWVVDCLAQALSRGVAPAEFPSWIRRALDTRRIRVA